MTDKLLALACALALVLCGCSSDEITPVTTGGGGSAGAGAQGGGGAAGGGGGATPTACEPMQAALDGVLQAEFASLSVNGLAVEIRVGECVWQGAQGTAIVDPNTPTVPDDLFRAASITKSFVATTVVMLAEEGALALDDPIGDYLTSVPNGENITIRQVLSHTSGIPEYAFGDGFSWASPFTPEELLAIATTMPPYFSPGDGWAYSNTNYIIAGRIIEEVTGNEAAAEIRARILQPLGLESTYLAGSEPAIGSLVHGYASGAAFPGTGCGDTDVTDQVAPTAGWTASAMVSSVTELNSFFEGLLTGQLLTQPSLDEMLSSVPTGGPFDYGLGVATVSGRPLGNAVGHGGSLPGFRSNALRYPESDVGVALLVNCNIGEVDQQGLLAALEQVVVDQR